jgi:NAD(P)H-quinone oxidoreductase subunit 4L
MIPLYVALVVGAVLFGIGLYGALSQTNLVMIMMGVELMLGNG